jgi:hypothetical protein
MYWLETRLSGRTNIETGPRPGFDQAFILQQIASALYRSDAGSSQHGQLSDARQAGTHGVLPLGYLSAQRVGDLLISCHVLSTGTVCLIPYCTGSTYFFCICIVCAPGVSLILSYSLRRMVSMKWLYISIVWLLILMVLTVAAGNYPPLAQWLKSELFYFRGVHP